MNSYQKVNSALSFGKLYKSAEEIAESTGLQVFEVRAAIDEIKRVRKISVISGVNNYMYGIAARVPSKN